MLREIPIIIGENKIQVYMCSGFFDFKATAFGSHRHLYAEIHIIISGNAEYLIGNQKIALAPEDMIVIPPNIVHACYSLSENSKRIAFQVDTPITEYCVLHLQRNILELLITEIQTYNATYRSNRMGYILSLVCAELPNFLHYKPKPIRNQGFLVNEFLSNRYFEDITLSDLAQHLGLSEKQATRLVKKYTGNNFRTELTNRRVEAAGHLFKNSNISMEELALKVGYKSYSGFWKAFNKGKTNITKIKCQEEITEKSS